MIARLTRAHRRRACGRAATRALIDGALVNGSANLVGWFAGIVRRVQSGYIYHYALAMLLGIFVLMTWFVWLGR